MCEHRYPSIPNQRTSEVKTASVCRLAYVTAMCVSLFSCARASARVPATSWRLVWSDEFDGPAGARADTAKWGYQTGDGCSAGICGWGNQEKEYYTDAADNSALSGEGQLVITGRRASENRSCYYGPCRYTSAKLTTKNKLHVAPGRVEARIKLPSGQGLWPAFWLLGARYPTTPWPMAGELDVMENHGSESRAISSAIHGPGYSGSTTPFVHASTLERGSFAADFHAFAVEWDSTRVQFFVDDVLHYTIARAEVERRGAWVFDQPFYVIVNLAVGGTFDGDPKSETILPATMLIDYVRVYAPR